MGGVAITPKYLIHATIDVEGVVEKSDVIGAIFGQTEGLLGDKLDLRELQKSGRIGRVQVNIESKEGRSRGSIEIPTSLDKVETTLIAAAIETVDKVGPCDAKIRVTKIEDVREEKRKRVIERAKELLLKWRTESTPEYKELIDEVLKVVREAQLVTYGSEKLPAGPDIDSSDTIIIVEGRADVVNLLRHDYRNVIAMEGAAVPKTIIDLTKEKTAIAFIDGDRGGELVLKELLQVAEIDYVARAPPGKEVEELTGKEIAKCLRDKVPVDQVHLLLEKPQPLKEAARRVELPQHVVSEAKALPGTLEALLYSREWKLLQRVPVRDLADSLQNTEGVKYVIYDGVATQRLIDIAERKGVELVVCARVGDVAKKPEGLEVYTLSEVIK
ncbi:MAG: DNA primase DnaG [Candidatus Nezhaarchaeota archaeon]|nr:DNA primase DnaG [Candidatus Nezhaarchaeota archaeon]